MSAIKYLKSVVPLIKATESASIKCESAIFRLHNKFTVGLLLGCSILLGATEFLGKPINCITSLPKNVINTYCWISSTFTMNDYSFREIGIQAASPGVVPPDGYDDESIQEKWKFHNYYQWVIFFLCFQAFLCYLPKYLWTIWEGGLMKSLSENLTKSMRKEGDASKKKDSLIEYIMTHLKMHNGYAYKYWACELLCFVNIIFQLFLIDSFLGGEFMQYGFKVLEFSEMNQEERVDPMIYVFPRMTKCIFHVYGSSGTIERRDAFCLLAQNILNEKIFIFVWFWYIILATLLGGLLVYRFALIFMPGLRPRVIYAHNRMVPIETMQVINRRASIGDWWILYLLARTIDPHVYRDVLTRVAKEIETHASNRQPPSAYPQCPKSNGHGVNDLSAYMNPPTNRQPYPNPGTVASAPPSGYAQSSV